MNDRVYGYVLLPVAFTDSGEALDEQVERLWEAGEFDLMGRVEHYHEDGGFAPLFVEAGGDYEAQDRIAMKVALRTERGQG